MKLKPTSIALCALLSCGSLWFAAFVPLAGFRPPISPPAPIRYTAANITPPVALPRHSPAAVGGISHDAGAESKQSGLDASLQSSIRESLYRPRRAYHSGSVHADNPAQGFETEFTPTGLHFTATISSHSSIKRADTSGQGNLRLQAIGRTDHLIPTGDAHPVIANNRVEYHRDAVTEWYRNSPQGIEQGFTIQNRVDIGLGVSASSPHSFSFSSSLPLRLILAVGGGLQVRSGNGNALTLAPDRGAPPLVYRDLKAWDARHKALPARMEAHNGQIALLVDDRTARYPITIDPLIAAQTQLTPADSQVGDQFGASVSVSGDFAIVGAPYHTVGANTNQGAAYVFVRNNSVWTQMPDLIAADGVSGDNFGSSVSVSGNMAVVSAPGHSYSTPGPVPHNGQGVAYVFTNTTGVWTQTAELMASNGAAFTDVSGATVSISGNSVVVGAPNQSSRQGTAFIFTLSNGIWTQTAQLTATDGTAGDIFGSSVSISGNILIVGAPEHGEIYEGAAYIFTATNGVWAQTAELTASDTEAPSNFGYSVSISGNTLIVGAPNYISPIPNNVPCAAYVFGYSGGHWRQQVKLVETAEGVANQQNDGFGASVGISGATIGIGASGHTINGNLFQGATFLYQRFSQAWVPEGTLTALDGGADNGYGIAVSVSGDTLITGAPGDVGMRGSAYAQRVGPEVISDDGAANDNFGFSVSVSGNLAVVGAPSHTVANTPFQGAAYVYTNTSGSWVQTAELTSDDGGFGDGFGFSVSISGNMVVVGAPDHNNGAAYVFTYANGGWTQTAELTAFDVQNGDQFGIAVSLSGKNLVVGNNTHNQRQGEAYVFTCSNGAWSQPAILTASDGAANDYFGSSVSISGNNVVIGAFEHSVNSILQQGAAYVFAAAGSGWLQTAELTAPDGAAGDQFGVSVSVSANALVIGAPYHVVNANPGQGAAYVFTNANGSWTQAPPSELTASDGTAGDSFGFYTSISGNTLVVSAPNHFLSQGDVYTFSNDNGLWSEETATTTTEGPYTDSEGMSVGQLAAVSVCGDTVAVGAVFSQVDYIPDQGAAFLYGGPTPNTVAEAYVADLGVPLTVSAARGVLANDPKSLLPWTVSLFASANHGSLSLNADGSFTYSAYPGFTGTDGFFYTVTNSDGETSAPTFVGITVYVAPVSRFTVSPGSVTGTLSATGTVILQAPVPIGFPGVSLFISSDNPGIVPPFMVVLPEGVSSIECLIRSFPVTVSTAVHLTAQTAGSPATATATLTVLPPALNAIKLSPSQVKGGKTVTVTVTLNAVPAVPTVVQLSSANPAAPLAGATVTIPTGTLSAKFTFPTFSPGTSNATGEITATLGAVSKSANLTVTP